MRVKYVVPRRQRRKKFLKLAKGYYGAQSRCSKVATQYVLRAWYHSYRGRKEKKRNFRRLWIVRINALARQNGLKYSQFIHGLKKLGVNLSRRSLAQIAFSDPQAFQKLCDKVKQHIEISPYQTYVSPQI